MRRWPRYFVMNKWNIKKQCTQASWREYTFSNQESFEYQNVKNCGIIRVEGEMDYDESSSSEEKSYLTGFLARPTRAPTSKLSSNISSSDFPFFPPLDGTGNISSSESESLRAFFLGEDAFALGLAAAAALAGLAAAFGAAVLGTVAFFGLAGPSVLAAFPRPLPFGFTSLSEESAIFRVISSNSFPSLDCNRKVQSWKLTNHVDIGGRHRFGRRLWFQWRWAF